MQVVRKASLAPGVCFICEQGWEQTGDPTRFVDTKYHWEPGGYTKLNGAKYLCEHCVREAARELGIDDEMVPSHEVENLRIAAHQAIYVGEMLVKDLAAFKLGLTGITKELKKNV